MSVLLFDIDGTLLHAPGVGKRHFESLVATLCGRPVTTHGISFAGRTDPAIAQEVFHRAGFRGAALTNKVEEFLDLYVTHFAADLAPGEIRILPGVTELLGELAHATHLSLGVLTGNLEPTARLKLRAVGLESFFPFGAFGSDHADRNRLPGFARDRAQLHLGRDIAFEELIVIGDTALDVACGKAVGARTVAVATGNVSIGSLAAAGPDLLLTDFRDATALLKMVRAAGN